MMWTRLSGCVGTRREKVVLGMAVAAVVPVLALGWWLGSPLFLNKEVNEDFPRVPSATLTEGVTAAEAEKEMLDAEAVTVEMSEDMSIKGVVAVLHGMFQDADNFHKGSGSATVYRLDDGSHVLRLEEIRVTNGPDLHIYLSAASSPGSSSEVKGGGYADLGSLKGNVGNQNDEIPSGVDVSQYGSVVIYCEPFRVVFSTASLG